MRIVRRNTIWYYRTSKYLIYNRKTNVLTGVWVGVGNHLIQSVELQLRLGLRRRDIGLELSHRFPCGSRGRRAKAGGLQGLQRLACSRLLSDLGLRHGCVMVTS